MSTELKSCLVCGCLSCVPYTLEERRIISDTGLKLNFFIDGTICTKCGTTFRNHNSQKALDIVLGLLWNRFGEDK